MDELITQTAKIHPIRRLGEIILRRTQGTTIEIDPQITIANPLAHFEDIEEHPWEGLCIAYFKLNQLKIDQDKSRPWESRMELAEFDLCHDASLIAVTCNLGVEALVESIARDYVAITGKEAGTYIRHLPFSLISPTNFRHEMPQLGATMYEFVLGVNRIGREKALQLLDEQIAAENLLRKNWGHTPVSRTDYIQSMLNSIAPMDGKIEGIQRILLSEGH